MDVQIDEFNRKWIIENSLEEISNYRHGELTLRGLHYRLVSRGMTNTLNHYKRVVAAMKQARWGGQVAFEVFSDHDRSMEGVTDWEETLLPDMVEEGKDAIRSWMELYYKNRWENQITYPEVFIEKKALLGTFKPVCREFNVALGPCKGYPSLTFLNDAAKRLIAASEEGKHPVILYFGDYDPSGEDIPRSIRDNLSDLGVHDFEVKRIALMEHQVVERNLPPAPKKAGDSRSAKWDGLGQVELDAIEPRELRKMCKEAIESVFDEDLYLELMKRENKEREIYRDSLRDFVNNL